MDDRHAIILPTANDNHESGRLPFEKWERRVTFVAAMWGIVLTAGLLAGYALAVFLHKLIK